MKTNKNLFKFKNLIYEKRKKNKIILNKKVHIKRNLLFNKNNIIPVSTLTPLTFGKGKIKLSRSSINTIPTKSWDSGEIDRGKIINIIIFRIKNNIFQHYRFLKGKDIFKSGIRIKIIEKLYKEFEKDINKLAKKYKLKVYFINNPFKSTTKKGILIRMGKGKGKIIENYKILEKNKILLTLIITNILSPEKKYLLLQEVKKLNNKYFFLSQYFLNL